jgi:hypothetical protein
MNTHLQDLNNDKDNKAPLLSDCQYLLVDGNEERTKFIRLFNWLDTQLEITEDKSNCIDKTRLEKHIIFNYFECFDFEIFNSENIDFVKQVLKVYFMFSTKEQDCHYQYQYIKYKD